jgi:hypothetical protein
VELITKLKPNEIFVFGSNLSGRHGKGAAKTAMRWGAKYGMGNGPSGQTYAIPTKAVSVYQRLPIERIREFVCEFLQYARQHKELSFLVTEIGCGLAGYKPKDIAPMFKGCSENVVLPERFKRSH